MGSILSRFKAESTGYGFGWVSASKKKKKTLQNRKKKGGKTHHTSIFMKYLEAI